jgi:hypothetical protein
MERYAFESEKFPKSLAMLDFVHIFAFAVKRK